jgi:hypothetical protein
VSITDNIPHHQVSQWTALKQQATPLVCECHDCTQARGLMRAGGLVPMITTIADDQRAMKKEIYSAFGRLATAIYEVDLKAARIERGLGPLATAGDVAAVREQLGRIEAWQASAEDILTHLCGEMDEVRDRVEPTRRIEQAVEEGLGRIELSQATLAGETMVLVLTKLLKLQSTLEELDHFVGLKCSAYARSFGYDVGDGDWREISEIVLGLLAAGRKQAERAVAITDTKCSSSQDLCPPRGGKVHGDRHKRAGRKR